MVKTSKNLYALDFKGGNDFVLEILRSENVCVLH